MLRALIADDDMAVAKCFEKMISWNELGYDRPYTAANGKEAYEIISGNDVDVIICDLKMPIMDGLELIKKLRENNFKNDVILLTAYEDFFAARWGIELKIYDYLLKPLELGTVKRLEGDLKKIADKHRVLKWVDGFIKDEYENEIMSAFESGDADYFERMFEKMAVIGDVWENSHLFQVVYVKIVDVLCNYLRQLGFNRISIRSNYDNLIGQIKSLNSNIEITDVLHNKILSFITNTNQLNPDDINKNRVEKIKSYIEKNYQKYDFSILDVSKEFSFSKDHLNRIFKNSEGITVSKYIIQKKLEEARMLIIDTDKSVKDIAEYVGYSSLSYFTSSFKAAFDITPTALREKCMEIQRNAKAGESE